MDSFQKDLKSRTRNIFLIETVYVTAGTQEDPQSSSRNVPRTVPVIGSMEPWCP